MKSLGIWDWDTSSHFSLVSQDCFWYSGFLLAPYIDFGNVFSSSVRNAAGIFIGIVLNLYVLEI